VKEDAMSEGTSAQLQAELRALERRVAELESRLRLTPSRVTPDAVTTPVAGTAPRPPATTEEDAMQRERDIKALLDEFRHPPTYQALLEAVKRRVDHDRYLTWFVGTHLAADDGAEMTIGVKDELQANWLERTYAAVVLEALAEIGHPRASVVFRAGAAWLPT
jgi:hypothetical protein